MQLFNKLHYAQNPGMHVSAPIATMDSTYGKLEKDYYQNRDTADKMEIAMANLEVNEGNEHIKQRAIDQMTNTLAAIRENGDWENASLVVRNAAKDMAVNSGLNEAVKDKKSKDAQKAALAAKVEAGDITQEDADFVIGRANAQYKSQNNGNGGLHQDETTGAWKGQWVASTPPKYEDRGAYIDEYLDGWESDKMLGTLAKGEDGKWYQAKLATTPDGSTYVAYSNEEAKYADIYQAAQSHLMQNQNMAARINFEMQKIGNQDYYFYADRGIDKESMQTSLSAMGIEKKRTNDLSLTQLTEMYKKNMIIHESVVGSVSKHAFDRESVQVIGKTAAYQYELQRIKNAKKTGGDDKTPGNMDSIPLYNSELYVDGSVTIDTEDYIESTKKAERELRQHNIALDDINKEIEITTDPTAKENLLNRRAKILETRNSIKNMKDLNDRDYNFIKNQVHAELGIETNEQSFKDKRVKFNEENNQLLDRVNEFVTNNIGRTVITGAGRGMGVGETTIKKSSLATDILGDYTFHNTSYLNYNPMLNLLNSSNDFTDKERELLKNYYADGFSSNNNQKALKKQATKMIDERLHNKYKNTTLQYEYINMTEATLEKDSKLLKHHNKTATDRITKNKGNYLVLDKNTGKGITMEEFEKLHEDVNIEFQYVGLTSNDIPHHDRRGYQMNIIDKDTEKIISSELFMPTTNDGIENEAARFIKNSQGADSPLYKKLIDSSVTNAITRIETNVVDKPDPNGTKAYNTKEDKFESDGKQFKVVTKVDRTGNTTYEVSYFDLEQNKQYTPAHYSNLVDLENDLTKSYRPNLKVPLSSLVKINENTFSNLYPTKQISISALDKDMKVQVEKLDAILPMKVGITSLTRDIEKNAEVNGDDKSPHMIGKGIDLKYTKDMDIWFEHNSTEIPNQTGKLKYRRIKGTNLKYVAHNAGSGNHFDIKLIEL